MSTLMAAMEPSSVTVTTCSPLPLSSIKSSPGHYPFSAPAKTERTGLGGSGGASSFAGPGAVRGTDPATMRAVPRW